MAVESELFLHRIIDPDNEDIDYYRMLKRLGDEPTTKAEIETRNSVAETTLTRSLNRFVDTDVLRQEGTVYHLTPVGEILCRELTIAMDAVADAEGTTGKESEDQRGREKLTYLLSSDSRFRLLQSLIESPKSKTAWAEDCGVDRITVQRVADDFEQYGLIDTQGGWCETTEEGIAVRTSYDRLVNRAEAVLERADFLVRLGERSLELPVDGLENTRTVVNDAGSPHAVLNTAIETTSIRDVREGNASIDRFQALIPVFNESMFEVFIPIMNFGTDIRTIDDKSTVEALTRKENIHYVAAGLMAPNVNQRVFPQNLTDGIATFDDGMQLSTYHEHYPYTACLVSNDERIVRWAYEEIDDYWEQSIPMRTYLMNNLEDRVGHLAKHVPNVADYLPNFDSDVLISADD